jgi:hypothetical protein
MFKFSAFVATSVVLVLVLAPIAAGVEDDSGSGGTSQMSSLEIDDGKPHVFPNACVKMALYNNTKCEGHAKQVLVFPTWEKPLDSPCCTYVIYCTSDE